MASRSALEAESQRRLQEETEDRQAFERDLRQKLEQARGEDAKKRTELEAEIREQCVRDALESTRATVDEEYRKLCEGEAAKREAFEAALRERIAEESRLELDKTRRVLDEEAAAARAQEGEARREFEAEAKARLEREARDALEASQRTFDDEFRRKCEAAADAQQKLEEDLKARYRAELAEAEERLRKENAQVMAQTVEELSKTRARTDKLEQVEKELKSEVEEQRRLLDTSKQEPLADESLRAKLRSVESDLLESQNDVKELEQVRDELEVEVEQLRLAASGEDSEEARVLLENVARLEEMVWILSGQGGGDTGGSYLPDFGGVPRLPTEPRLSVPNAAAISRPGALARKRALCIGCDYGDDPAKRLQAGVSDARRIYDVLGKLGITERQLLGAEEVPSLECIRHWLDWLFQGARPGDTLVLSFCGHGAQLPNGEGALVPSDFNANETRSRVLPLNELSLMAAALPVGVRVVWLLDCSHGVPALNGETRTVEIPPVELQIATPRTVGMVPLDVQNFAAVPPRINC